MRAFDASAVERFAGIDVPVDDEVRELAGTIDAGVSSPSAVGERLEALRAATKLWGRATEAPASVRPVAPTLERALRAPERGGGDATVTDLYVSGVRERRRELVAATLESVAAPALVRGYEASAYSLQGLVAAMSETLTATTTGVVREYCLRALGAIARVRPAVVRAGLTTDAVVVAVEWLHANESAMRWEATAVGELLAVTLPTNPSVREEAPVDEVLERLLEHEAATPRAVAQAIQLRAPGDCDGGTVDGSEDESFAALTRLDAAASLEGGERRERMRTVGRCVALVPDLVADAPAALVGRVRMAPRAERAVAATALGEVVAHSLVDDGQLEASLVDRVHAATGDRRDRWVRVLGEVAVACPDRVGGVPEAFRERVAAAPVPARSSMRAVGESVVAAAGDERGFDALRVRVQVETGPTAERAAAALGEWLANVPDVVDAPVDSLAAVVMAASEDERADAATILGTYAVVEAEDVGVGDVVDASGSARAARVRGERALAGGIDPVEVDSETRALVRGLRGRARRYATRALGVAAQSRASTRESAVVVALREAVAGSLLAERPTQLRLLGEWVAATGPDDRGGDSAGVGLAERVSGTSGTDRERAARALGLATMERDSDGAGRYGGVVAEVVARLHAHDEVVAATRRAVERAAAAEAEAGESLPAGVPAGSRDWSVRALGELAAVAPGSTLRGAASLAATVEAATGWDRQRAARALGVAVILDAHGPAGLDSWTRTGLAATPQARGALTYVLGEVAAAHPEQFPGVPEGLVANVRDASDGVRTTTARALGEYVRQPTLGEPGSARALKTAAASASRDTREALARALGETIVAVPAVDADVPKSVVDAVRAAADQDRRALARLLGELVVTDDPGDVLDRMAPTSDDEHVFERARRSRMTQALVTVDAVDLDDFLGAVSITAPSTDAAEATAGSLGNVEALLDAPAPIRDPLLDAFTATLERDETAALTDLDDRLDAWLRKAADGDRTARLHAMAARSALDTTAVSTER
jgi:hypothetical protein